MKVLVDTYPLSRPILLESDEILATLSDGALYVTKLPRAYDGLLHWTVAGRNLEAASTDHTDDLIKLATDSLINALATDGFLKKPH